jgi:ferritin-like metal-binding protein YciE
MANESEWSYFDQRFIMVKFLVSESERRLIMAVNNPKDLFVMLLSNVRQHEERATKIYQLLSEAAQDTEIKEALESRVFMEDKILSTIDKCFKLIGKKPVDLSERLHDVFVEDFKKELAEIKSPVAKILFVAAKANHVMHFRVAEYMALVAMADVTEHYGVGVLLESCLADKLAFIERTRRLIRERVRGKVQEIRKAA